MFVKGLKKIIMVFKKLKKKVVIGIYRIFYCRFIGFWERERKIIVG